MHQAGTRLQEIPVNTKHLFALAVSVCLGTLSQANAQTTMPSDTEGPSPMFVVHTTPRTVQAVNYQHHGGATKIDFAGTPVMSSATGFALVKSQRGSIAIEAEF